MNIRKILPMEVNFEIRNFHHYWKKSTIHIPEYGEKRRFFYLDAASYGNMGDQAIAYAISVFLQEEFPEFEYIGISEGELIKNLRVMKKAIRKDDIICLSGGGNMGTLYPRYEVLRRKIIKKFPYNPIIIFPQSLDYETDDYGMRELRRSSKIYNAHKYLSVFARETKSFCAMQEIYNNVFLTTDIVFYLKGKIPINNLKKENVVGVCLRDDKESILTAEERNEIMLQAEKLGDAVVMLSTTSNISNTVKIDRFELLKSKLKEFSKCKLIITDRLHGMVFAALLCIPCIILDNSNRKVSGVYALIADNVLNVKMLDKDNLFSMSELAEKISKVEFDWEANMYTALVERIRYVEGIDSGRY